MSFVTDFVSVATPVADLMDQYGKLYAPARSGKLDENGRQAFADIGQLLNEKLQLVPVSPEEQDSDLQAQLLDKDLVHKFGVQTPDELKAYRLGSPASNKTAYALINPEAKDGQRQILAAIYTYWQHETPSYITDYRDLAGNVSRILHSPVMAQRPSVERAAIFYSISTFNVMSGAGQMLIDRLHTQQTQQLNQGVVLSTLSPLRGFAEWLKTQVATRESFDDHGLKQAALTFLLANADGVQRFHMGNGAMIGDINLDANEKGSADDVLGHNTMVNYVYARSPAVVAAHRARYSEACVVQKTDKQAAARMIYESMAPALQAEIMEISEPRSSVAVVLDQPRLQA
jgi:hypothetical protein